MIWFGDEDWPFLRDVDSDSEPDLDAEDARKMEIMRLSLLARFPVIIQEGMCFTTRADVRTNTGGSHVWQSPSTYGDDDGDTGDDKEDPGTGDGDDGGGDDERRQGVAPPPRGAGAERDR